jgi:hypothetical protein
MSHVQVSPASPGQVIAGTGASPARALVASVASPQAHDETGVGELDAVDPCPLDLQDAVECRADAHVRPPVDSMVLANPSNLGRTEEPPVDPA